MRAEQDGDHEAHAKPGLKERIAAAFGIQPKKPAGPCLDIATEIITLTRSGIESGSLRLCASRIADWCQ